LRGGFFPLPQRAGCLTGADGPAQRSHPAKTMRDDDLGSMRRAVLKPDGIAGLLRWLARRLDADAVLLNAAGEPELAVPRCPDDVLREVAGDIKRVITGTSGAAAICGPSWWARIADLGGDRGGPALLVTARTPLPPDGGALIAHAAALLQLRWSADERDRAIDHVREAVLHLLMAGQVSAARRVSDMVKPALASVIRVYLLEGPAAARNKIASQCEVVFDGRAWIVRCPVYRRHVIILAPGGNGSGRDPDGKVLRAQQVSREDVAIGAGNEVSLRDAAAGYEQAYHALAVARHRPDRFAQFTARSDLAALLGPGAQQWARRALAPLLNFEPPRPQDPCSGELCATLRSWLDFRAGAWKQLKIHRNTLLERIRHIEAILGRDLEKLPVQAELHLALRLLDQARAPDATTAALDLDDLLATPPVEQWAQILLAPLAEEPGQPLLATVRAWLEAGARSDATAAVLGVSARSVHRRLVRAEHCIGRALLGGPSARYDVLLALRIRDMASAR